MIHRMISHFPFQAFWHVWCRGWCSVGEPNFYVTPLVSFYAKKPRQNIVFLPFCRSLLNFDQLLVYIIYFFHRIRLSRILFGQSIGIQIKGRWYSMVNLLGCLCLVFCDWVLFGHFGRMGAILLVDKGNYNFLLL